MLLLSLVEPDTLKRSKFTDYKISIIKDLALGKLHRQRIIKKEVAIALLESEQE